MIAWLGRHPYPLMVIIVLGASFLAAYPLPVLLLGAMGVACWCASTLYDKRNVTKAGLRQRAEFEHWLVTNGDLRGVYGNWRR